MNETMGQIILRLRRENGLTQEQLANALGISYQAVSKWETGNSCPDIAALPLLADLFGVSIDTLFGRETGTGSEPCTAEPREPVPVPRAELPWPDDDAFYAVLYHGHELIGSRPQEKRALKAQQSFRFQYEGPAQDLHSAFDVELTGTVCGSVQAGGDVSCDAVYGNVDAGGDVTCDEVSGDVTAGGSVTCDEVSGDVRAGGDVTCDNVDGDVTAGGDVSCDEIAGSAFAGESVHSDHPELDMRGRFSEPDGESSSTEDPFGEELGEKLGNLSAWGADLGRRIAESVERNLGKQGGFTISWSGGKRTARTDREEKPDDGENDE